MSKTPSVLGTVIIIPATVSSQAARSASRLTSPFSSDGSSTTCKPAIETVAGLVPCALFGHEDFGALACRRDPDDTCGS